MHIIIVNWIIIVNISQRYFVLDVFRSTFIVLVSRCGCTSGKSSESVQCAITGPCLHMRHRPSA